MTGVQTCALPISHRLHQRRARTGQILHAAEHLVLLRGGRHQERPGLPLARLQRHARVTHLARQQQPMRSAVATTQRGLAENQLYEPTSQANAHFRGRTPVVLPR